MIHGRGTGAVRKAVRDGSHFDTWTSGIIIAAYAIPGFLFAIMLMVVFAVLLALVAVFVGVSLALGIAT